VAGSLVVADYPGDHARSITRHIDLHVSRAGEGPFALDPRKRLVVFRAADFSLPPRWRIELYRDPSEWFALALIALTDACRSALDQAKADSAARP
jgi:hypothetical protein